MRMVRGAAFAASARAKALSKRATPHAHQHARIAGVEEQPRHGRPDGRVPRNGIGRVHGMNGVPCTDTGFVPVRYTDRRSFLQKKAVPPLRAIFCRISRAVLRSWPRDRSTKSASFRQRSMGMSVAWSRRPQCAIPLIPNVLWERTHPGKFIARSAAGVSRRGQPALTAKHSLMIAFPKPHLGTSTRTRWLRHGANGP